MVKDVVFKDRSISITSAEGRFERIFKSHVKDILQHQNKVLVRVEYAKDKCNRNIFCLNERAEILWEIQDPDDQAGIKEKTDSPFIGMRITENGRLRATSWNSYAYDVDMQTGKISNPAFTK